MNTTLFHDLGEEIVRQDLKHGPFEGSRLGRTRLALAVLEDEVQECLDAYREGRPEIIGFNHLREELLQVAAVAIRAIRDI